MNYYILNCDGTKWGLLTKEGFDSMVNIEIYKQIKLYDNDLNFVGIGLY